MITNNNKLFLETMQRLQDELHRIYLRIVIVQQRIEDLDKKITDHDKLIDEKNKNKK